MLRRLTPDFLTLHAQILPLFHVSRDSSFMSTSQLLAVASFVLLTEEMTSCRPSPPPLEAVTPPNEAASALITAAAAEPR